MIETLQVTTDNSFNGPKDDCDSFYFTIDKVVGRDQDFIVSKSGRIIPAVILNFFDDTYKDIFQFQLFQEKKGIVIFRYVPKKPFTSIKKNKLLNVLNSKIGNGVSFQLKEKKEIKKTKSGKYKFMIQNLIV